MLTFFEVKIGLLPLKELGDNLVGKNGRPRTCNPLARETFCRAVLSVACRNPIPLMFIVILYVWLASNEKLNPTHARKLINWSPNHQFFFCVNDFTDSLFSIITYDLLFSEYLMTDGERTSNWNRREMINSYKKTIEHTMNEQKKK